MKSPRSALIVSTLSLALACHALAQVNITTWQVDNQHTGANLRETILTPEMVSSPGNFGLLFWQKMDGQCYTQPLYVSGVKIGGTPHNVIYLETQHCTVYAFDADNNTGANAKPLWSKSLIKPGTIPVPQSEVKSGDISQELGNTATPVISLETGAIYGLSKLKVTADGSYQQYFHALDLATGAEKPGSPVLINPTFPGTAKDSKDGVVPFNALREHERCALTLYKGIVYLMYASHSDTQPYHGEIIGYDARTLQQVKTFITSPNSGLSGIWQGGASAAIDGAGNMFIAVGNGDFRRNADGSGEWGESLLKLPTTGKFEVSFDNSLNWFVPFNWGDRDGELNHGDLDLGSSGLTLLPDQKGGTHPHLMVAGGKGGTIYLIDRDNLGGNHPKSNSSVQEITEAHGLFSTPAYFNGCIYYATSGGKLTQRAVCYNPLTGGYLSTSANKSNFTYNGGHGSGSFITANGAADGIVWTLDLGQPARLHAYNAANVSGDPIFSGTATLPGNINVKAPTFGLPMAANGKVYFAGYTSNGGSSVGYLLVYGRPAPVAGAPAAPTALALSPISSSQITLNWKDNSDNESGFKIKRAISTAGPFVEVMPSPAVGANVTSFTDTHLSPSTTYFYQVFATNSKGDSTPSVVQSARTFPLYAEDGLVAYWNLDETGGGFADDSSGHGHEGKWEGEQYPDAGIVNGGHFFHGTGAVPSRISAEDKADLRFAATQSFTLSAWVKPAALRNSAEAVIAKSREAGNYYGIWIDATNHWVARGPAGDVVGPLATQGGWTHVALVQDGIAGTRKLYVNGVAAASGAAQAADGHGAFWIGQANGVTEPFPGDIDEVRVYHRALSAAQITTLLAPPVLQAVSTMAQGAGTFSNVLWPGLAPAIEPRKGATPGDYNLVLSFAAPVSGITASLALQDGGKAAGSAGPVAYDSTGKVATIPLTGVGNVQALNLHLSSLSRGGTADVPFDVLWGDVNRDHVVTDLDERLVTNLAAPAVTRDNYLYDVNGDGVVNAADATLASSLIGTKVGAGTETNLALFAPAVSSSIENKGASPAMAFDGDPATRWESKHGIDPQWIYVDLGSVSRIHSVSINWENAAARTYQIQTSNVGGTNAADWKTVATETNNPGVGIKTYPVSASGRYVRMYGTTRTTGYGYSIFEMQVMGMAGSDGGSKKAPTP